MTERELILGIDGGGTGTTAWLSRSDAPERPLGRGTAGPSNINSVGSEVGLANLDQSVRNAFEAAGIGRSQVSSAVLGLAGADRAGDRKTIEDWAVGVRLSKRLQVVNDALPILYASDPSGCGVALIVGTGSFAYGRNAEGATVRCGGLGHLLGDEGSGYAIALAGLRAAARSFDGREHPTELLPRFLQALSCEQPMELVTAIYRSSMDRTQIACLSGVVFSAAESGDECAKQIIREAAAELSRMVVTVARQLKLDHNSFPLAIAGGVILNQQKLREELQLHLERSGMEIEVIRRIPEPVVGAIGMALGMIR